MSDDFEEDPPRMSRALTATNIEARVQYANEHPASDTEEAADPYYESYFCDVILLQAEQMHFPEVWADEIGVSESRMHSWCLKYPEFAEAYSRAITKLRAEFSKDFVRTARGTKNPDANAAMYVLLAKKRFPDLFGDVPGPPPAPSPFDARDITPQNTQAMSSSQTIEGKEADRLREELERLRRTHNQT